MDIREFSEKLADATKNMTIEERAAIMKMFQSVSKEIGNEPPTPTVTNFTSGGTGIPNGMTERHRLLKENYMTKVPTITIHRAKAVTKMTRENPGMPKILLRAKCFRACCESAPLVIQDNELIVGAPCGAPRAGAFSPDIAWRWLRDE
ncbi:MAG: pyruvate formate lyase family protein, partial [Anaerotignaceae bacterium]